ncbi:geranylgeranyl diphosphate synthase, type II [Clostridium sp. USBA 49]|jgi:geranylgeranyl diphosphate synthase type II|uniref:polyprenyl synthetase family protein n=1 Tax=Clostridium TaxID=1485 RepID=UPI00099964F6|nr:MULTISPECIES: farnesyl diphosphate synthase [Clostridium]SKA76770.1 geranylgeranyl diphosphate synthase, type II [Clostridium sp. USBA 49]
MKIENLTNIIENYLKNCFKDKKSYNRKIYDAMYYSLNLGGKRIRPLLFLITYGMYKNNYDEVIPVAAAIEMIHTYSLIHDDLPCMDNDDFRRGKLSNHKVFGEGIAVLAGDALLNEAMNIMFEFCAKNGKEELLACSKIALAAGADGMIGGQVVDILSEGKNISKDELFYMHSKKTGALITASIICGAMLGKAPHDELIILEEFGEKLGLAFQIKDDILNVEGDKELLGKSVNSDKKNNKTNFISIYGIEKSKYMCITLTEECIELLNKINKDTSLLKKLTLFLLNRNF